MHDPMTVAFDIHYPWPWPKQELSKKRDTFITVWHVDPESDGSDDSCGYSFPKPSDEFVKELKEDLEQVSFTHVEDFHKKYPNTPPESLREMNFSYQQAVEGRDNWMILWMNRASFYHRKHGMSPREIARYLYASSFPGNRDNFLRPDTDLERTAWIIARCYLHYTRPWWRHPKWHVRHWKVQIHPLLHFKRWMWSRCCVCGNAFKFGEAPVSGSWESKGPGWFKGEENVRHTSCEPTTGTVELSRTPRHPVQ